MKPVVKLRGRGLSVVVLLAATGAFAQTAPKDAPVEPKLAPAGVGAPEASQALPPEGPVLTLQDAMKAAAERNLDLVQARARLAQARTIARKAWAGYLPQLTAGGRYTYNSQEAVLRMPAGYNIRDFGRPTSEPFDPAHPELGAPTNYAMVPREIVEIEIQKRHMFNGQVGLNQALLVPALWPAINSAYLAGDVAELSVQNARREILFATAQLYYGAEGLREALGVQQRQVETLAQHERDARVRYEVGTTPRVAYLRAQIERARAEQDLKRTQNAYRSSKSALAALLDRAPDFEVTRPERTAPPQEPLEALMQKAPERRLDALSAKKNVELARSGRLQVWMKYLPSIAGFAQYSASNAAGFSGQTDSWVAGAALNWNILDGGLREAELRESAEKIVEANAAARASENRAKDEVRRAFYDLESAEANRVKAEEQVKLARENYALVNSSYEAGAGTYLEVVDAQTALLGAELASVSEGLNAELAALKLARAAGLFEPVAQATSEQGR